MTKDGAFEEIRTGPFLVRFRADLTPEARAALLEGAAGSFVPRGRGERVQAAGRLAIRKHYRHGGLLGPLLGRFHLGRSRAFAELAALVLARRSGVPVPEPLLAACARGRLGFGRREFLATEAIQPGAGSLLHYLTRFPEDAGPEKQRERANVFADVGRAVRTLHESGIHHRDLHLENILLQEPLPGTFAPGSHPSLRVFLLDFDRARRYPIVPCAVRERALARLLRSIAKWAMQEVPVGRTDMLRILRGYAGGDKDFIRRAWARARRQIAWHSPRWRLSLSKGSPGRLALEYYGTRAFLGVLGFLPARFRGAVASLAGFLTFRFDSNRRRRALGNLDLVYGDSLTSAEKRRIARASFGSFLHAMFDFSVLERFARATSPPSEVEIEGKENLEAARKEGRPLVFVTGHLGAWEIAPAALRTHGFPFMVVVRPPQNRRLAEYLSRRRALGAENVVPKRGAARFLLATIRAGQNLGFLADQAQRHEGIFADFLGHPATSVDTHGILAVRYGLPIVVGACVREGSNRWRIILCPPLPPPPDGTRESRARAVVQAANDAFGSLIRRYPAQYLWSHERWKIYKERQAELDAFLEMKAKAAGQT